MTKNKGLIYRVGVLCVASLNLGIISGCTDIKKTMGLETRQPSEFEVSPYQKTLEVPRDFELLPPQTGDASKGVPFSEKSNRDAHKISPSNGHKLTDAEKNLLEQLGPGLDAQDQYKMDAEAAEEKSEKRGLLEGAIDKKRKPKGDVINPQAEKERLQKSNKN